MTRLRSEQITLSYGDTPIVIDFNLDVIDGEITTIIGPNGCGKSTMLRALARLMKPSQGSVLLDGSLIHHLPTREVAKRLGLLAQQPIPPSGITVEDLVRRGRYPHQGFMQAPSRKDAEATEHAMELAGVTALRDRSVDQLSGGQRQRAWIAMALAQETPLLLLDEPTTYLDIAHQLDIIDLVKKLNEDEHRTIVMVLHDMNEAARASHRIIAMREGRILHQGTTEEVLRPEILASIYDVDCDVYKQRETGHQICVPRSIHFANGPTSSDSSNGFEISRIATGYEGNPVIKDLSLSIPAGKITAIVGPNACGKSTLIRTVSRLMKQGSGSVELNGKDVRQGSHKDLAKRLSLLAQGPIPPSGFLVEDLVASGRVPHQSLFRQWRSEDEEAVELALARTGLGELRYRELETLSGGQRQRAWFAMSLAQDTPVLVLDEPTSFLDISAQVGLLDLARSLNREEGRTIVMILHDLNLAARYADIMVAMKAGELRAIGTPTEIITEQFLRDVFDIEAVVSTDPIAGSPLITPIRSLHSDVAVAVAVA
jgi:iron complex transport system ATP-binding protein